MTPTELLPTRSPAAPLDLKVVGSGHHQVELTWSPSPGANYYSLWRTTLYENGIGGTYPIGTILLEDAITATRFVDTSPTDGKLYSYQARAINAAGESDLSTAVTATPLPPPPAAAPGSLTGAWVKIRNADAITLKWSPVPGATGYVVYRSPRPDGQFRWPEDFVTTLVETTYTDKNSDKKDAKKADKPLVPGADYSYQVTAVNVAGVSPSATVHVEAK